MLIFCADYEGTNSDLLHESCTTHGIDLQSYGNGKPWPGYVSGKIRGALEFLRTRSEKIALYADGNDSFVIGREQQIQDAFRALRTDVLISTEQTCWPDSGLSEGFVEPCVFRFLNSGGWMGYTDALINVLTDIDIKTEGGDDQREWTKWYLDNGFVHNLDHTCRVFQTMGGNGYMTDSGENQATGTHPLVWHFNGRSGTDGRMQDWYRRLLASSKRG